MELGEREPFYANISDERTKFSFTANRKKIMGNYLRSFFYQQQINYKKKLSKKHQKSSKANNLLRKEEWFWNYYYSKEKTF